MITKGAKPVNQPFDFPQAKAWGLLRVDTEQSNSYAEKVFADASATGTIALAVYKEKIRKIAPHFDMSLKKREAPAAGAPSASSESRAACRHKQKESEQPGTGFGETTYSPAYVVQFDPEYTIAGKIVLKYEWRLELCQKESSNAVRKTDSGPMIWNLLRSQKTLRDDGVVK
jgi:hypothetical protein